MAYSIPKHVMKFANAVLKSPVKTYPQKNISNKFKEFYSPKNCGSPSTSAIKCVPDAQIAGPTTILTSVGASGSPFFQNATPSPLYTPKLFESDTRSPAIRKLNFSTCEESCDEESEGEIECDDEIEMDTPTRQQVSNNGLESLGRTPSILGQGGFGVVIKAKHKGNKVAVKIINKSRRRKISIDYCLDGEMNAMTLKHPNIVETYGIFGLDEKNLLILMEFGGPRSLQHLLDDVKEVVDWERRLRFSIEVLDALQYCHACNMVHLDIKPANVIVSSNDSCKLCDFGCSKKIDKIHEFCDTKFPFDGTVAYKAPELLRGQPPTVKADVYSYGITLWQLITREIPFAHMAPHEIVYKVVAFEIRPLITNIPTADFLSNTYVKLFIVCWQTKPEKRSSCNSNLLILRNLYANLRTNF